MLYPAELRGLESLASVSYRNRFGVTTPPGSCDARNGAAGSIQASDAMKQRHPELDYAIRHKKQQTEAKQAAKRLPFVCASQRSVGEEDQRQDLVLRHVGGSSRGVAGVRGQWASFHARRAGICETDCQRSGLRQPFRVCIAVATAFPMVGSVAAMCPGRLYLAWRNPLSTCQ